MGVISVFELNLTVQYASDDSDLPSEDDFNTWVTAALNGQRDAAELSIRLVDEAEGRQLNCTYRHKDYATNVLSFSADLPPEVGSPLLGDLVICAPVVMREATEQGKDVQAHWAHMTVHGVLHLLGMDHQTDTEAEVMEAQETAILATLGFADPYQPN